LPRARSLDAYASDAVSEIFAELRFHDMPVIANVQSHVRGSKFDVPLEAVLPQIFEKAANGCQGVAFVASVDRGWEAHEVRPRSGVQVVRAILQRDALGVVGVAEDHEPISRHSWPSARQVCRGIQVARACLGRVVEASVLFDGAQRAPDHRQPAFDALRVPYGQELGKTHPWLHQPTANLLLEIVP